MSYVPRNLASGSRLVAQGRVVDVNGRPTDATITVYRGSTTVGSVRSVAGRFAIFDLVPSAYTYRAAGVRGGSGTGAFAVNGSVSSLTVRI
jgi:hypothetical protein